MATNGCSSERKSDHMWGCYCTTSGWAWQALGHGDQALDRGDQAIRRICAHQVAADGSTTNVRHRYRANMTVKHLSRC